MLASFGSKAMNAMHAMIRTRPMIFENEILSSKQKKKRIAMYIPTMAKIAGMHPWLMSDF